MQLEMEIGKLRFKLNRKLNCELNTYLYDSMIFGYIVGK